MNNVICINFLWKPFLRVGWFMFIYFRNYHEIEIEIPSDCKYKIRSL